MFSEQELHEAETRGRTAAQDGLRATSAAYDPHSRTMHVAFGRGFTISFPKERSQVMAAASDADLAQIEVQGGYILFPRLDDGFTVEGMLAGRFGNSRWEQEWAERHLQPTGA